MPEYRMPLTFTAPGKGETMLHRLARRNREGVWCLKVFLGAARRRVCDHFGALEFERQTQFEGESIVGVNDHFDVLGSRVVQDEDYLKFCLPGQLLELVGSFAFQVRLASAFRKSSSRTWLAKRDARWKPM